MNVKSAYFIFTITLLSFLFQLGCVSTTTKSGAVGVKRKQMLLVSQREAEDKAAQLYNAEKKRHAAKGALNASWRQARRVRHIANHLIAQVGVFRSDALNWHWEVNVISSPALNAYCMPGGKIAVYTGLINKLRLTDNELAAVIGHEIAHALREHAREQMSTHKAKSIGISVVASILNASQSEMAVANTIATLGIQLPHSRAHEREADIIGIELAARAGYNPMSAVHVWEKMVRAQKGRKVPQFLSTHPDPQSRIKDIRRYAGKVMPLYEKTKWPKSPKPPKLHKQAH